MLFYYGNDYSPGLGFLQYKSPAFSVFPVNRITFKHSLFLAVNYIAHCSLFKKIPPVTE